MLSENYIKLKDLTPISMSYVSLYKKFKDDDKIRKPKPLDSEKTNKRDKSKFCISHKYNGRMIDTCNSFKVQVEKRICKGKLQYYVKGKPITTSTITVLVNYINAMFSRVHAVSNSESRHTQRQKKRKIKSISHTFCINTGM